MAEKTTHKDQLADLEAQLGRETFEIETINSQIRMLQQRAEPRRQAATKLMQDIAGLRMTKKEKPGG